MRKPKQRTIKLSSIKPFGNLDSILERFEKRVSECEKDGYSKEVPRLMKLIAQFGLTDAKDWFEHLEENEKEAERRDEVEMIVLLGHMYFARLNNVFQKDMNKIKMKPLHVQIAESESIKKYFPNTKFIA